MAGDPMTVMQITDEMIDRGVAVFKLRTHEQPSVRPEKWDEWDTDVLTDLGFSFESVADGWKVGTVGTYSVWDTTPLKAWNRWKLVNDGR